MICIHVFAEGYTYVLEVSVPMSKKAVLYLMNLRVVLYGNEIASLLKAAVAEGRIHRLRIGAMG